MAAPAVAPESQGDTQAGWEGTVFNERYRKIKVVGKGSFGEAVLVRSKANGRRYIVKAIDSASMSPKEKRDVSNEIRIMSTLNHPNIVKYHEHFDDGPFIYIAMEYADGGDLHQRIREQRKVEPPTPFDPKLCVFWMLQIAMALKYLHDRHILHRDLKTANIFLTSRNVVKLGDFGISTVLQSTMACAKTVCGTPYYFSPELCQNRPYNNKSDVWALGIIFYETLTLIRPFNAKSLKDLLKKILIGQYEPLPTSIPEEIRQLSAQLLSINPSQRPSINGLLEMPIVQRSLATFAKELEEQSQREKDEHDAKRVSPAKQSDLAIAAGTPPPTANAIATAAVDAKAQMAQLRAMGRGDLKALLTKPNPALQQEIAQGATPPTTTTPNSAAAVAHVDTAADHEDEGEGIEAKQNLAKEANAIVGVGKLGGHEEEFGDAPAPAGPQQLITLADGRSVPPSEARAYLQTAVGGPLLTATMDYVSDMLASPQAPSNAQINRDLAQLLGPGRAQHAGAIGQLAIADSKAVST